MVVIRTSIDTRELRQLAFDLTRAPGRIQRRAPRTMTRARNRLERAMHRDATGHRYLHKFAQHIGSDVTDYIGLAFEVGFDKVDQGELAHIIVFGSVNNAPVYDFHGPLVRETPRLANDLGDDAYASVLGGDRAA